MKYVSRFFRLMRINYVLMRYNLGELILGRGWFSPFRFMIYLNPYHYFSPNKYTRGQRLRFALQALGPIFIKAGQVLSTRRDLLPDDIAEELSLLQDRVPPFSGRYAQRVIEAALGLPVSVIFSQFDSVALASASIAQVHAATLLDGKQAVVKVLRPGIRKIIERDVDLLFTLARLTDRYSAAGRRFKPKELVAEVAHTLFDELDLMREGANASQLKRNFKNSPLLYIPEIYWNLTNEHVLVMERIYGIPIHNIDAIRASGINLKKLAERGVEIFFTQVFRDSFFHADMHPGNIFVSTNDLENPQCIAVDFGIVGSLSSKDKRYLAENMLAFFKRDYQRVAELHISSGWVPPDTRIDLFEGAIRAVCEPIFARPLKDISFGQLLMRLFQTARRFNIDIQPQLVLLQKTLLNIEGVGRQIYPDLDIWQTSGPYLERWLKDQVGAKSFIRRLKQNAPYWAEKLPEIPNLIFDVLNEKRYVQEYTRFQNKLPQTDLPPSKKHGRRSKLLGLSGGFILSALSISYQPAIASLGLILGGLGVFSFIVAEFI